MSSMDEALQKQILDLLASLENYEPLLPEPLLDYHLTKSGIPPDSLPHSSKAFLSVITEKFVTDILEDSLAYYRARTGNASGANKLCFEDLQAALADRGINVNPPAYHF